jgi:hypothetical protein
MQSTKSSTLSEPEPVDYKAWLDDLLAVIHRDGGQYTILTGYLISLKDAHSKIFALRTELLNLKGRNGRPTQARYLPPPRKDR